MNNSIAKFILNIGNSIEGPTFIKDYEDSEGIINELKLIADSIKEEAVQEQIKMDIMHIKAGDQGEKNVYYELKNSFIPMLILHNVVIQYDDYKAQMDYVLITSKFICILETKKLNGNITVNNDGDFIRSIVNKRGKVIKKEGMYSPISQNQRHKRILENLLIQEKIIKKTPVLSLVVIANPKSIVNYKYTKREIKNQIVKYDQLTPSLKRMLKMYNEVNLKPKVMNKIANFLSENHVEPENTFAAKYKKDSIIEKDKSDSTLEKSENNKIEEKNSISLSVDIESIRETLVKYRLDKSREENIKPYYIFNNKQLDFLLERMPNSKYELMQCKGFGKVKVDKYGEDILRIMKTG